MQNNTIIVYRSKTGYTRKYAAWLQQVLQCDCRECSLVTPDDLLAYDTILYGGGVYAGRIHGLSKLLKEYQPLREKHWVVFATGLTPASDTYLQTLKAGNLTPEQRERVACFYLPGGLDYQKVTGLSRILLKLMKKHIASQQPEGGEPVSYEHPNDFTKREALLPLLKHLAALEEPSAAEPVAPLK